MSFADSFKMYFGGGSVATVAGVYDTLVNGDKSGVLLRCDDIDRNCATQDGYAGHWRGAVGFVWVERSLISLLLILPIRTQPARRSSASFHIRRGSSSMKAFAATILQSPLPPDPPSFSLQT
jgi:hypothetical protein